MVVIFSGIFREPLNGPGMPEHYFGPTRKIAVGARLHHLNANLGPFVGPLIAIDHYHAVTNPTSVHHDRT
jgi:hypothetical protein